MKHFVPVLVLAVLASSTGAWCQAEWPAWRGPLGTGLARDQRPPTRWSRTENIKWKAPVPGLGISTPIVWRDRVYLTTAIATDRPGKAGVDEPQSRLSLPRPTKFHDFAVIAIDRATGRTVWNKTVTRVVPHEGGHATNSLASSSPVTDGERIYANFGSRGLYCLDLRGNVVWSKDLGRMRTRRQYGEASSPAVWGRYLVVNWDHEGDSFLVVFDKRTGEELWRKPRDEVTSWSTPTVVTVDGRPQIVINATAASRGYDLETGDVVWRLGGMTVNCIPSPVHGNGVVYLMSGYRGRALQAVKLSGAAGDLAGTDHVLWTYNQGASYVPSALLYDDHYYFLRGNTGVLSCLDAKTGKPHFEGEKLEGVRSVYASPVGAGGHVYVTSREGVTQVLRHGVELAPIATNDIGESVDASLAIVDDEILLRGHEHLYCIAHAAKSTAKPADEPKRRYVAVASLGDPEERTASLSTADLDGDGDLDLVVANGRHWPGQNQILLGDGRGGFAAPQNLGEPDPSYAVALADFDGDGDIDAVVGNDRVASRVYWNDGKARFVKGAAVGVVTSTRHVLAADLDGKHGPDLVFSNRGRPNVICFNDGKGGFARHVTFGAEDGPTIQTEAGDLDGDGDLDLVVANRGTQNRIFLNDGSGGFRETRAYGNGTDQTRDVALADIDGDGKLDIVNANIGAANVIYFGDGKAAFARRLELEGNERSFSVAVADLNGDGRLDLVFGNVGAPNTVWRQQPDGTFASEPFGGATRATYGVLVADWSSQGTPQIATANSGAPNELFSLRSR